MFSIFIMEENMSYTLKNQNNYNQQAEHQRMLGLLKNEICSPSFEGNYTYPYLDSAQQPNATIGCGININQTPNLQLSNINTGKPLTDSERSTELTNLYNQHLPNAKASYYQDKTNIGITPEENERIMQQKFQDAYHTIKDMYPQYDTFSDNQKKALYDMHYNLGTPKFKKYIKMQDAINNQDWDKAAQESIRKGVNAYRNNWTAQNLTSY